MFKRKAVTLLIQAILPVLLNIPCFAQSIDQLVGHLDSLYQKYPFEKVHLQLDKTNYNSGEMIWFKAYITDESNLPTKLSRILYLELIDQDLHIVRSLKLPITASQTSGNILIDTLKEGNYELRAYTKWMRNYGEESFYNQKISINSQAPKRPSESMHHPYSLKSNKDGIELQFFPEGGYLVDGIRSNVVFEAKDSNGLGTYVSGYVVNEVNLRVAEFKSEHAGLGSFMLTPFHSKYTAVVSLPSGEQKFLLPVSETKGYIIHVLGQDREKFYVRISASQNMEKNTELAIIARSGTQTHYVLKFKMTKEFIDISVPKKDLPMGIIQLSLLDQRILPVAERLIFNRQNDDRLNFSIDVGEKQYRVGDKIQVKLIASNEDINATGNFSVSVTDVIRDLKTRDNQTIMSSLYLRSELKNQIDDLGYYFTDTLDKLNEELDQLLLTQTWYRRTLKEVLNENLFPVLFNPEKSLSISGTVLFKGKPVAGGKISLFAPDAGSFLDTITNNSGKFNFDRLVFFDSTKFIIQARSAKGKDNVEILLDTIPEQKVIRRLRITDRNFVEFVDKEKQEVDSQSLFSNPNVLQEVVVSAVKDPRYVHNSSKLGKVNADYVFRPEQLSGSNLGNALIGKVIGIEVKYDPHSQRTTAYLRRNQLLSEHEKMQLRLFVDGADYGYDLSQVPVTEIATVEILKGGASGALYGDRGFGGVIIVTTKTFGERTGDSVEPEPNKGMIKYVAKGFSVTQKFQRPILTNSTRLQDAPDLQPTIYWNPNLDMKDGEIEFEFTAPSRPGSFRVVVEGIDSKGRSGRESYIVNVHK